MKPPHIDDGDVRIWHGDALTILRELPSESVHMAITSPPFWGLRDYGTGTWTGGDDADCDHLGPPFRTKAKINQNCGTGQDVKNAAGREPMGQTCSKCGATRTDQQIGLEATPDEWCTRLVEVFRELRRVLRSDGTFWLEVGDSYNQPGSHTGRNDHASLITNDINRGRLKIGTTAELRAPTRGKPKPRLEGLKPKDLVGAPWLLAFALRQDGWYLRSDIIWARPNPMPESVTDRPTKAHSMVFLLTKSPRYFYDADAIRETNAPAYQAQVEPGIRTQVNRDASRKDTLNGGEAAIGGARSYNGAGRNARSVWSIATEPTPFAHFATFPQTLVERAIKAGTSEHGVCAECGAPWRRVTESQTHAPPERATNKPIRHMAQSLAGQGHANLEQSNLGMVKAITTTGWEPTCTHHASVIPATVYDPFMGSATTALVARRLARHSAGSELSLEYLSIAATRLQQLSLLTGGVA